ncbi:hypothetical protein [Enterobacter sp. Bisph1]|uniref:hypothetical protein n=1 Tax=Enterobacter sp. Bisph1 TaxID=1274399 RepID=UPI001E3B2A82|nr:hypothetical protein [Enterobacter sp. Bisph1]
MIKFLTKSLVLSGVIARQIKTTDPHQLEKIKDRLKDRLGIPVGWHMSGSPLLASMILTIVSFALAQPWLWLAVFNGFGLPQHAVMAAIVPVSLIYSLLIVLAMYFVARGSYSALKIFLVLLAFSGLVSIINFIAVFLPVIFDGGQKTGFIVSAILSLLFIITSIRCINSRTFYRSNALFLHNRVWRKQLVIQRQSLRGSS